MIKRNSRFHKKKEIEITKSDLKMIYGTDYDFFQNKVLSNCHCINCTENRGKEGYTSTIVHYHIFLKESGDIILNGRCSACGSIISRYLETGEVQEYGKRIWEVRRKYVK